jgi:hypothetical protein
MMSSVSGLCDTCSTIDFSLYFLPPVQGETGTENAVGVVSYKEKDLGVRSEIRRRKDHCTFCRLVCLATDMVSNDAKVSMGSNLCGRNQDTAGVDLAAAYYIRIGSDFQGRKSNAYIQLHADDAHLLGISQDFRARLPNAAGFDMSQACKWLELCRTEHGNLCSTLEGDFDGGTPPPQPLDLLAIDLFDMSICDMPQGAEYIALSYCWPATAYLTLEQNNREKLFRQGALLDNMDKLPGTVQDAIRCAKELPFQYLWIDALCIVQDDYDHKDKQLRQMDRVYSCASLTLVCAYPVARDSHDLCSGFPGYHKHDQARHRSIENVKGLRMMVACQDVDDTLLRTRWYTRCWYVVSRYSVLWRQRLIIFRTYQEQLLSCRLLYFTPAQVYFQCSCSVFCEDVHCESIGKTATLSPGNTLWNSKARHSTSTDTGNWGGWDLSRKPLDALTQMLESYEMALSAYTYRDVSYPSDILKAFEGIKVVLSAAMQTDFWQGIPEKILAQALCWQLTGTFRRRRLRPVGQPPSEPLFPSWTWAGWDSSVNLNYHMAIKAYRTDAEWYIINNNSVATRLNVHPEWISLQSQRPAASVIRAFLPKIVPREDVDATSEEWRDARTLACWTTCASFVLDGSDHQISSNGHERLWPESTNFAIKDKWGDTAGCILLPKSYFEDSGADWLRCEFILISRSLPLRTTMSYFDEEVYKMKEWCHLNIMLISRRDEFRAFRVGVGIVHKDAWVAAKPETTFVKLV